MNRASDIFDRVQVYFRQQGELYGSELYLDSDVGLKPDSIQPESLAHYFAEIKNCQKCGLSASRTKFVFGVGNPHAKIMCIGEAPGFDEDRQGEPFVGAAGQLLNKILAAIGFKREEVYIANIIKCRPPQNRDPEPEEIAECAPHLMQQIELIRPKLILVLGRIAAQALLGVQDSLSNLRTRSHSYLDIPVVVTYHPAALLRSEQWKRPTWEDMKRLRQMYDELVGDKPPLATTNK